MMKFLNRKWKKFAFFAGITLISLYLVQILVPLFVGIAAPTTKNPLDSLKILSYNVQFGANDDTISLISGMEADIVGLQELTAVEKNGDILSIEEFADELSFEYYAIPSALDVWSYGLVIFSHYNITQTDFIHICSDDVLSRGILIAEIDVNGTLINVIDTHLDVPFYYVSRYQHAQKILDVLENSKPLILLGDFNTPNSLLDITYWSLFTHLHDSWIASGKAPFLGKTWHVSFPFLRIDYIWVNDLCTVVKKSAELAWNIDSSDHKALAVRIAV
jgi:endonuclease/exonuclease/phosphatase family metal-dependent hydrolase